MRNAEPYISEVWAALPRVLASFDTNPSSWSNGQGDRFYWAWKLIDFGNGTFQGAAHGLARLLCSGLVPEGIAETAFLRRIEAMAEGAARLTRGNGSLEEAFPNESSFCVTALVAFDLLTAVELLDHRLESAVRVHVLDVVRPMIAFLHQANESHGLISNHLATATAALFKWEILAGEPGAARGRELLDQILRHQSEEGWFPEYQGADPGYQTLLMYYLADLHRLRPDLGLLEPLHRSIDFLWHFAHPDGSFGGLYGSRNTRFYYPAGLEFLRHEIPEAEALARAMRRSISERRVVTLAAMDAPNLVPMFNAYCWAAALTAGSQTAETVASPEIPALSQRVFRKAFRGAGLLVDKGEQHYTVISWHKGGVCCHFPADSRPIINAGVAAKSASGRFFTSQAYEPTNLMEESGDTITVTAPMTAVTNRAPTPIEFLALRSLCLTLMRNLTVATWIKRFLVRLLITGKRHHPAINRRTIRLGKDLHIADQWSSSAQGLERLDFGHPFSAIHMASQGYWQKQDDSA